MTPMDYRKRLGLSINDAEKASRFYAMLHNYFISASTVEFDEVTEAMFCDKIGALIKEKDPFAFDLFEEPIGLARAWIYLKEYKTNVSELLFACTHLINVYPKKQKKIKEALLMVILNALDECQLSYELLRDDEGVFIFPKGAKEFDDTLVSQPLEWLTQYPQAHKTFCVALRQYSDGTYIRDVADNLRKALEEFLREFLKNDCDLNKNKREIEAYLKSENADPQLINMFGSLITHYYLLNNEIAKHNDKVDSKYLEFLLYQTGIFIRMLIVVKQSTQEESADAD